MTAMALGVVEAGTAPTGEAAKSGPWGLAVILLLCLACYFLFKSMSKHMRKVREQFPTDRGPADRPGAPRAQAQPRPPADAAGAEASRPAEPEPQLPVTGPAAPDGPDPLAR